MSYGPQRLPRLSAPIPKSFQGLGEALGWTPAMTKTLWSVLATTNDPWLKGTAVNYILVDDRISRMNQDGIIKFIKSQASPRVLVRILEVAVQRRVLRRSKASQLEEKIFAASNVEGAWKS